MIVSATQFRLNVEHDERRRRLSDRAVPDNGISLAKQLEGVKGALAEFIQELRTRLHREKTRADKAEKSLRILQSKYDEIEKHRAVLAAMWEVDREANSSDTEKIQRVVCAKYRVLMRDLLSPLRHDAIVLPRQIAMYLAKTLTTRSFPELGREFNRDHTTVLHAFQKITKLIETNEGLALEVAYLIKELNTLTGDQIA